jgi:hypothetical protein
VVSACFPASSTILLASVSAFLIFVSAIYFLIKYPAMKVIIAATMPIMPIIISIPFHLLAIYENS